MLLEHRERLILGYLIRNGEMSGRSLREGLGSDGARCSRPTFFNAMARMEDDGWVKGRYTQEVVDGVAIRERVYEIAAPGIRAWQESDRALVEQDAPVREALGGAS